MWRHALQTCSTATLPAGETAAAAAAEARGQHTSIQHTASELQPAKAQATANGAAGSTPEPRGRASLAEVQQVIKEVLGAEYCLKESAVSVTEVKRLRSLALVRSRVAGLKEVCGTEAAAKLLSSTLRVMEADPVCLRERLGVVATACGCNVAAVLDLCGRRKGAAELLLRSPQRLELTFATLWDCLGLQTKEDLHQTVREHTRMLNHGPSVLRERHTKLGGVLRLDAKALSDLLQRRPHLLCMPPATVKAGVEAVRDGLELGSWEEAVQVAIRNASLLSHEPKRMVEVVRWLKQRLQLSCNDLEHCTMLLGKSEAQLEQHLNGLPDALGIPLADVLLLAKAAPRLLFAPAATTGKGWAQLKAAAALQPQWRAQLLAHSAVTVTCLLGLADERVSARLQQLAKAAPSPKHLPALSTLLKASEPEFKRLMQRVQDGTFKARTKPPTVMPDAIVVVCPSLAAQL